MTPDEFRRRMVAYGLLTQEELDQFFGSMPERHELATLDQLVTALCRAGLLTPYQARQIAKGEGHRLVLGEYVILDRLGGGGMGEVFRARHRTLDREVALKLMRPSMMEAPGAVERFRREVRTAAKLMHPNIVLAHDGGEFGGVHYLVLEFVPGVDLETLLRRHGPFSVQGAVECVLQAARGLAYAHDRGVIHRDIKPSNLLLSREGVVKILDLGLARLRPLEESDPAGGKVTWTGQLVGTVDFMAPEQIRHPGQVDHRVDIYALGCTLYRLLTGAAVYEGGSAMDVLLAHLEKPVPRLRDARPDVPEELDSVFQRMVAKEPDKRYQRMEEVVGALEQVLNGLGLPAKRAPGAREGSISDPLLRGYAAEEPAKSQSPVDIVASELESGEEDTVPEVFLPEILLAAPEASQDPAKAARPSGWSASGDQRPKKLVTWAKILAWLVGLGAVGGMLLTALYLGGGISGLAAKGGVGRRASRHPQEGASDMHIADTPPPSSKLGRVIIIWQESERGSASLLVDKTPLPLERLLDPGDPNRLVIELTPGVHTLVLDRGGLEQAEFKVEIESGKDVVLRPEWRPASLSTLEEMSGDGRSPPAGQLARVPLKDPPGARIRPGIDVAWERVEAVLHRWEAQETHYLEAVRPVEELVRQWAFDQAVEEANKIDFADEELRQRWELRQKELRWLAAWQARIIQRIRTASPRLQKAQLGLKGPNGELVDAEESGITCLLVTGKEERLPWTELEPQAARRLMGLVIDQQSPEEFLQAAVFFTSLGDATEAARYFRLASDRGINIGEHLELGSFGLVRELVDRLRRREYASAQAAFDRLIGEAGLADWRADHAELVAGIGAVLLEARREAEAESLYAEAVNLFRQELLYDVKPLIERLQTEYANTTVVLDARRRPSVAELSKATACLGRRFTVRQDGKGDFRSIQAAIDAAPPYSLIEICDSGVYQEKIVIEKEGTFISGVAPHWPIIASLPPQQPFIFLVEVKAHHVRLERIIMVHQRSLPTPPHCATVFNESSTWLRRCIIHPGVSFGGRTRTDTCFITGHVSIEGPLQDRDSIWIAQLSIYYASVFANSLLGGITETAPECIFLHCTISGDAAVADRTVMRDCLLRSVRSGPNTVIEFCCVTGTPPFSEQARPGTGTFQGDPLFVSPADLDYRLQPGSPCVGRASDGGDIGVRWTPEMLEMIQVAIELRRRGLISF